MWNYMNVIWRTNPRITGRFIPAMIWQCAGCCISLSLIHIFAELAAAVKANSDAIAVLQGGTADQPEQEEYPEYIQPAGAHEAYNTGDKITSVSYTHLPGINQ